MATKPDKSEIIGALDVAMARAWFGNACDYWNDHDNLVEEKVIAGAAYNSVTFSGLDALAAGGYVLIAEIVNSATGPQSINAYVNGDTAPANYYRQVQTASTTTVAASSATDANIAYHINTGCVTLLKIDIAVLANQLAMMIGNYYSVVSGSIQLGSSGVSKMAAVTNITSLTLSGAAGIFGIGSRFRLEKRGK